MTPRFRTAKSGVLIEKCCSVLPDINIHGLQSGGDEGPARLSRKLRRALLNFCAWLHVQPRVNERIQNSADESPKPESIANKPSAVPRLVRMANSSKRIRARRIFTLVSGFSPPASPTKVANTFGCAEGLMHRPL
jgi:hypothetical protein